MLFWALAAVLGAWLGHANLWLHFPAAVLLLPAGLAGLALSASTSKKAFARGFWTGTAAFTGGLYWIVIPVHQYGGLPLALALPCPVLLSMYLALFSGLFCLLLRRLSSLSPWLLGPAAGALWAGLEMLREWLFTGFPWLTMASAFGSWPVMLQAASLVGGGGLALLLVWAAIWLGVPGRLAALPRLAGAVLLAALFLYGHQRLDAPLPASSDSARTATALIGIAQGNFDQSIKWNKDVQAGTVNRYLSLSEGLLQGNKPDLVIWPETALPFYYEDPSDLGHQVREFARTTGMPVISGAPAYTLNNKNEYKLYNRAYLIDGIPKPAGTSEQTYDKVHLVPFGEYMPLPDWVPLGKLVDSVGDFVPGTSAAPLRAGGIAAGVLICYEAIYADMAQDRVAAGANVLAVISNDAWFGVSSSPLQHLHLSLVRSVEQGRAMVRSTNTGISAFVDAKGRIQETTPLYHAAALAREVELRSETTFFHRHFSLMRGLVAVLALLAAAVALAGRLNAARS